MLDRPTVFVIGAGAGFDIDMPLGDKLADLIAEAVSFYYDKGQLVKGNAEMAQALQRNSQSKKGNWDAFLAAGRDKSPVRTGGSWCSGGLTASTGST